MATNGLKSSVPIPETLPPKKRNSRENSSENPSEHVFKTPSPFWNQNGFKRIRRPRETNRGSLVDPHLESAYHPQWSEAASMLNPTLSYALDNSMLYPWGQHGDTSDLVRFQNLYGSPYYWNYIPEPRDHLYIKSYQTRPRGQHRTPIVKPIPQMLACHYSRGIFNKDNVSGEETRQRFEAERVTQWHERLHNQRALQDWRTRKRDYTRDSVNWDPMHFSRHKHYSEFKDLLQDSKPQDLSTDTRSDLHHQQLPVTHPSCSKTDKSKWNTEEQTREREESPLLARTENAESQKQTASSWPLSRFTVGSLIELVGGKLKRVEDLKMEDFESCTELCPELSLKRFTVQKITRSHRPGQTCLEVELEDEPHSKLSLEVCEEYPFFVCGRGWSSCSPEQTAQLCCLHCHQLHLGDVCLALTPVPAPPLMPTQPGTEEGDRGHLGGTNGTEKSPEVARTGKRRKRHHSAPELRNILQHQIRS